MKKKITVSFMLVSLMIVFGLLFLISQRRNSMQQPQSQTETEIFPLNAAQAEYYLSRTDEYYSLTYYRYGRAQTNAQTADTLSVLIGSTATDLDSLGDGKVQLIGNFYTGTPLCRRKSCTQTSPRPVIAIQSIQVIN